ncbi:MAG: serine/threonine-protein kinase [Bryobacteraceae bacterium]
MPLSAGVRLGPYEILSRLGAGGMGEVWKARDTRLNRVVAIKTINSTDKDRKRRFLQEAQAASALNHPNIITIHDLVSDGGADYLVMEFIPGRTLGQLIPRTGMRLNDVLKLAIPIADALDKAHRAGIVHRDLKPGNVMVSDEGQVKLLDFGLAKLTEALDPDHDATRTIGVETEVGAIVGTVSYMSPEQAEGKHVDSRSDIFAFGAVLYEMVTGRRSFMGDTRMSTLAAILHHDPKPPSEWVDGLPRELERLITRCLRKDPARRFLHMDDLKVALEI